MFLDFNLLDQAEFSSASVGIPLKWPLVNSEKPDMMVKAGKSAIFVHSREREGGVG